MAIKSSTNDRNVNVALDIIKRYMYSKERKELLATCILFHLWRSNGVIWDVTYRNLMKWLCIGKPKAKRIIRQISECDELFKVNGTKVSARSLRDKTRRRTKKGRMYSGATCALIKNDREYSLKDIYNLLNDISLFARIKGGVSRTSSSINYTVPGRAYLTCRSLAKTIGMSRSSVQRITKRLKDIGTIIKDPAYIFLAIDSRHEKIIREALLRIGYKSVSFIDKRGYSYIIVPNGYAINDANVYQSIRHKIYGYKPKNRNRQICENCESTIPQLNGY